MLWEVQNIKHPFLLKCGYISALNICCQLWPVLPSSQVLVSQSCGVSKVSLFQCCAKYVLRAASTYISKCHIFSFIFYGVISNRNICSSSSILFWIFWIFDVFPFSTFWGVFYTTTTYYKLFLWCCAFPIFIVKWFAYFGNDCWSYILSVNHFIYPFSLKL